MCKEREERGMCTESEVMKRIRTFSFDYCIAFQTDRFLSGSSKSKEDLCDQIECEKLLEIRLFSSSEELLAVRTMLNREFQWRIASEKGLQKDEYLEWYQTLDIDSKYTENGEFGNLSLRSTGGGKYELPIGKEMDRIKVISYISYDEDGMAYIRDNRLAGFEKGGTE